MWEDLQVFVPFITSGMAALIAIFSSIQAKKLRKLQAELDKLVKSELLDQEAGNIRSVLQLAHDLILERKQYVAQEKSKEPVLREMKLLVDLMGRVKISTGRFTHMSGTLSTDLMVDEATHTFAIIADFFAKSSDHLLLVLPSKVADLVAEVRRELTQYFSRIDLRPPADRFSTHLLNEAQVRLNGRIEEAQNVMRTYLAPEWEPIPEAIRDNGARTARAA